MNEDCTIGIGQERNLSYIGLKMVGNVYYIKSPIPWSLELRL